MAYQNFVAESSISIAIPVYNQASTIVETIDSALNALRGYSGVEVVISENHSTDGTRELVEKYKSQVRIVRPIRHLSMAENWNFAVRGCSGRWVGMLSGDDRIYRSYIPALRKAIRAHPAAVFCMGGWNVFDLQTMRKKRRRVLSLPSVVGAGRATGSLIYGPKASFASYCFLKSAFEECGGFPEEYNLIQDWVLQFKLSLIGGFTKTNKIVAECLSGQSRKELEHCRVPLYCEDLATFCVSDIWSSVEASVKRAKLLDACEHHMRRAQDLAQLYPEFNKQVNDILRPVYELIGRERVASRRKSKVVQHLDNLKAIVRFLSEKCIPA